MDGLDATGPLYMEGGGIMYIIPLSKEKPSLMDQSNFPYSLISMQHFQHIACLFYPFAPLNIS